MAVLLSVLAAVPPSAPTRGLYCAVDVRAPADVRCSDDPGDLDAFSARGDVRLAAAGTVRLGRLYDNAGYDTGAGFLDVYGPSDCTPSKADLDFKMGDLGDFNGRVSSFKSYGSCAVRLWSGTGFSGTAYPSANSFFVGSSNVGSAFNDSARSVQFS